MDQWKREAIKVLREMEFGKTILDYGDPYDPWDQPWEERVCPICECEGYHAVDCKLQQLLTPPRGQLMLLKNLWEKEGDMWFTITDSEVDLRISKGSVEGFISDMVTYGLIENTEEYGDWFYRITCTKEYIEELLNNTREEQ